MREAAALPLIFITAWEGLVDPPSIAARRFWSRAAYPWLANFGYWDRSWLEAVGQTRDWVKIADAITHLSRESSPDGR